jgi:hypothetical protein
LGERPVELLSIFGVLVAPEALRNLGAVCHSRLDVHSGSISFDSLTLAYLRGTVVFHFQCLLYGIC